MQKDTIITISGTQITLAEPEGEPLITTAAASYHYRDQKHYIMYDEMQENSSEAIHNTIKITDDRIELIKKGAVNVKLEFEKGQKVLSSYILPFGSLMLGILTKKLDINISDDLIECKIEYELEVSEEHVSDCVIELSVTGKTAE